MVGHTVKPYDGAWVTSLIRDGAPQHPSGIIPNRGDGPGGYAKGRREAGLSSRFGLIFVSVSEFSV